MSFFEVVSYLLSLFFHMFTEVPFFGTGLHFSDVFIAIILFYGIIRILVLLFWGNGHD